MKKHLLLYKVHLGEKAKSEIVYKITETLLLGCRDGFSKAGEQQEGPSTLSVIFAYLLLRKIDFFLTVEY